MLHNNFGGEGGCWGRILSALAERCVEVTILERYGFLSFEIDDSGRYAELLFHFAGMSLGCRQKLGVMSQEADGRYHQTNLGTSQQTLAVEVGLTWSSLARAILHL